MIDNNTSCIIELPKKLDKRGNLSFFESTNHVPFDIKRTYWIYDVPGGESRGGHAYKRNREFIVALSGSFNIIVDDGKKKTAYQLNRSYYGLYIPNMYWREMNNFSTNSFALVVASECFDPDDYIRDYDTFVHEKNIRHEV